jgi:predicted DNA-binding transcriptional regulator AlpA
MKSNMVMAKYWWGQKKSEKKIHWMKWSKLCKVKEEGGIGFRDLHAFNLALLAKQVWRLTQNSESLLYRVYKAKYFPSCSFLNAKIGSNPSFIWRSFLGARDLVKEGSKWKVGNGCSIRVWEDNWLPFPLVLSRILLSSRLCMN